MYKILRSFFSGRRDKTDNNVYNTMISNIAKWFRTKPRPSSDSIAVKPLRNIEKERHIAYTCLKHNTVDCTECMDAVPHRSDAHQVLRRRYMERSNPYTSNKGAITGRNKNQHRVRQMDLELTPFFEPNIAQNVCQLKTSV